jgi:hypothetical protein
MPLNVLFTVGYFFCFEGIQFTFSGSWGYKFSQTAPRRLRKYVARYTSI